MTVSGPRQLLVGGGAVPLPCFFPSVSSVKTNLRPVDYVELLAGSSHPLYLVSAYDIANATKDDQVRIQAALGRSRANGATLLLDCGNYEAYWQRDASWLTERFHAVSEVYESDLCLCYDNQQPGDCPTEIADDVVASVLRDQQHTAATVVPIVHGRTDLLPAAARSVAEQLCPVLLAVPERLLGDGVSARVRSVRRIRRSLDSLGSYFPLHLLGTGNPASVVCYALAGADSFDGLEWCQTVADHQTGMLFHFQQWDFFRHQTAWGSNNCLPYVQSALMHNLEFYNRLMRELGNALAHGFTREIAEKYVHRQGLAVLAAAADGGD